ncbi:MAG: DNA mismatch repair protein [Myxococcales bacterium]|nr:DNA mismatch repair protein [Myxococcales bacterium]
MPRLSPAPLPDLLNAQPTCGIDLERAKLAITLAFAGGTSGGLFGDLLEQSTIAPSTWQPASYAGDLFLQRFVAECFKIQIGAHQPLVMTQQLLRVLAHPPAERRTVEFRREILRELLDSPELRKELETLYLSLCRFRAGLEAAGGARNPDPNQRQLDLLVELKTSFECMARGFATARSGLSRLADFGAQVLGGEAYRALDDLLRYDGRLGNVTLKVGVGADGRIRGFDVVSLEESTDNPFVNPPWRRWLARVELFLRGYRFGHDEVMARLLDAVFTGLEDEIALLVPLLRDLEFYLGALCLRDRAEAAGLAVCLPKLVSAEEPRRIEGLFNPLLLMSGVQPVPCTLVTERLATTVLVTGPNSGGKTRLLQSIGLAQLLAQSGLFIPARSGSIALAPALVMSLIEETRADQAEGRLGMELMRIRHLFERLPPGAMVLLDELCSGTNPSEGEEIFELVVTMLGRLRPQAFITTHFLTFAARLERERKIAGLSFLQVELGPQRRPTYQFTEGVAETSLAGHTAERLGVTGEQLLALIDHNLRLHGELPGAHAAPLDAPPPAPAPAGSFLSPAPAPQAPTTAAAQATKVRAGETSKRAGLPDPRQATHQVGRR